MVKLRQLLLSNELRRYIDLHTDGRTSSDSKHSRITWDRLFNQVATLVLREVEHCIKPVTNRRSSSASQQGPSKGTKMSKVLCMCVCMHAICDYLIEEYPTDHEVLQTTPTLSSVLTTQNNTITNFVNIANFVNDYNGWALILWEFLTWQLLLRQGV